MSKKFFNREDAEEFYKERINKMLQVIKGQEPVALETLKSMLKQSSEDQTNLIVESMQYRKKIKNSTFLKQHYKNKNIALQEQIDQVTQSCEVLNTAILLCEALKLNDTSSFSANLLSDEVLNKVIDYKIEQEKAHNAEAEKNGGKKSTKFTSLYEELDENQYAIFDMYK